MASHECFYSPYLHAQKLMHASFLHFHTFKLFTLFVAQEGAKEPMERQDHIPQAPVLQLQGSSPYKTAPGSATASLAPGSAVCSEDMTLNPDQASPGDGQARVQVRLIPTLALDKHQDWIGICPSRLGRSCCLKHACVHAFMQPVSLNQKRDSQLPLEGERPSDFKISKERPKDLKISKERPMDLKKLKREA
jgi:hypothetical protein